MIPRKQRGHSSIWLTQMELHSCIRPPLLQMELVLLPATCTTQFPNLANAQHRDGWLLFFSSFAWILLLGASDHFLLHLYGSESKNFIGKVKSKIVAHKDFLIRTGSKFQLSMKYFCLFFFEFIQIIFDATFNQQQNQQL